MTEKVVGYLLLIIGIAVIGLSTFNVYQVFTRQILPIQLFNFAAPQIDFTQIISSSLPQELAAVVRNSPAQKQEIISAAMINDPFNITAHLFLMGFIAGAGYKLASLGVMLIRPIVVKVKEQNQTPKP